MVSVSTQVISKPCHPLKHLAATDVGETYNLHTCTVNLETYGEFTPNQPSTKKQQMIGKAYTSL